MIFFCKEREQRCPRSLVKKREAGRSSTATGFRLVTQSYPRLRSDDHPNSQVSVETPSFECLGVFHCHPAVSGMEERGEKSVTAGEKFGFDDLAPEQSKAAADLDLLLQLGCFSRDGFAFLAIGCLIRSILTKFISWRNQFFYFIVPWLVLVTNLIVIGVVEALGAIKNCTVSW